MAGLGHVGSGVATASCTLEPSPRAVRGLRKDRRLLTQAIVGKMPGARGRSQGPAPAERSTQPGAEGPGGWIPGREDTTEAGNSRVAVEFSSGTARPSAGLRRGWEAPPGDAGRTTPARPLRRRPDLQAESMDQRHQHSGKPHGRRTTGVRHSPWLSEPRPPPPSILTAPRPAPHTDSAGPAGLARCPSPSQPDKPRADGRVAPGA